MAILRVVSHFHTLFNICAYGARHRYGRLLREARRQKPRTILEIGVWRGDRALELIDAARQSHPASEISYFGFDLFEQMPADLVAQEASRRTANLSRDDVLARLAPHIQAGAKAQLIAGNTMVTLPEAIPSLPAIDLAFIDGGHSYETVKSDWENVAKVIHDQSVVVFDDYVNEEAVRREGFGVNQLVGEIDRGKYDVRVLGPVDWWGRPWGLLKNQLAMVRPKRQSHA